ncbi:MAG TPA: TIGR00730 family Rossman fold protein [Caulobacterales bacterium]|nr:TIGR00730 family Rossman fold protein [Caulobacterales bacterium]
MDHKTVLTVPRAVRRPAFLNSICVYCGSSQAADPAYLDLARRFGGEMARRGIRLVYGGGRIGLMGAAAAGAHEAGGKVLGVMPRFLADRELVWDAVEHRMVDTMHERKLIMFEESDAFVALPGGIGTLEEIVEVLSWRRLELHEKPIALLSEDDFWAPFFHLIDHTVNAKLTPATFAGKIIDARSVDHCFKAMEAQAAPA